MSCKPGSAAPSSDEGVHIIDAFVGTGNFIVRLMREIPKTQLEPKYRNELWCNEVLLLPYYIASLNIEHEFYEATGEYLPFEGISLVDTFDLAEERQLSLLTAGKHGACGETEGIADVRRHR